MRKKYFCGRMLQSSRYLSKQQNTWERRNPIEFYRKFWPFLHISPSRFHTFVKESVVLPRLADLLIEGPGQREAYRKKPSVFVGCPSFNMLALRLDFR